MFKILRNLLENIASIERQCKVIEAQLDEILSFRHKKERISIIEQEYNIKLFGWYNNFCVHPSDRIHHGAMRMDETGLYRTADLYTDKTGKYRLLFTGPYTYDFITNGKEFKNER